MLICCCTGLIFQQGGRGPRDRDGSRPAANTRPTRTLFVINFDPIHTRVRDIERHFESYGKILNVRIRRNFAFVQFETQEEATKALECTNLRFVLSALIFYALNFFPPVSCELIFMTMVSLVILSSKISMMCMVFMDVCPVFICICK